MRVGQMYPSKTLDGRDLFEFAPDGAVVTIEKVDFKTFEAKNPGDAEIAYYLYTREFRKPFKLGKMNAESIEQVLGTDESDEWIGQTIMIRGFSKKIPDRDNKGRMKIIWLIDVDMVKPTTAPTIAPKTDISGMFAAARPKNSLPASTQIGAQIAIKIAANLHLRGKNIGDLVAHLHTVGMGHLVADKTPPQWPNSVLAASRTFSEDLPRVSEPMPKAMFDALLAAWGAAPAQTPTEVIDPTTGEVIPVRPTAAPAPTAGATSSSSAPGADTPRPATTGAPGAGTGRTAEPPPRRGSPAPSLPPAEIREDDIPF